MGWRASGILGGFNPPLQSMSASSPHSSASVPRANKDIFPRKVLSHLHMLPPLLQPHLVLSHSVLFPTILGWLHPYQCMRHTRALYILGFYKGKTLFAKKQLFFCNKIVFVQFFNFVWIIIAWHAFKSICEEVILVRVLKLKSRIC